MMASKHLLKESLEALKKSTGTNLNLVTSTEGSDCPDSPDPPLHSIMLIDSKGVGTYIISGTASDLLYWVKGAHWNR